jgi:cysteine desulfurase
MALYLDHNGTTAPDSVVLEAMLPWLGELHANPHADHVPGRRAAAAVECARASVANLIGADAQDIYFTSGATESNNLILQGLLNHGSGIRRLLISAIEHKSILAIGTAASAIGVEVMSLQVDSRGRLNPKCVAESLGADGYARTVVAIMHANNEIGTIQPIKEISTMMQRSGAVLHVDAAQTCGKLPIDVDELGIDYLSMSSHKLYGPAGIGAVYIGPGMRQQIRPLMFGGGQQDSVRPGTVPVFLAVGFGTACELARKRLSLDARHLTDCATAFLTRLTELRADYQLLGDLTDRLPGLISLWLPGVDAEGVLRSLSHELYGSTGSACTSGEIRSSHVYRAIGLSEEQGSQVIRLGFGRHSSIDDAVRAAELISAAAFKN